MGQTRYFDYKDDDKTDWLNRKDLAILPPGLYAGFDFDSTSTGTVLKLKHTTTGYKDVGVDQVESPFMGMYRTRQGCDIIEDATVNINIVTNAANISKYRIDTIVAEHEYVEVDGGVDATYVQILGTPQSNSFDAVAPALTFPKKQTLLGYIFWPIAANTLADPDIVYTKADVPSFAADTTLVRTTNTVQRILGMKAFDRISKGTGTAIYDGVVNQIYMATERNLYILEHIDDDYKVVEALSGSITATTGKNYFEIMTLQRLLLKESNVLNLPAFATEMYIEPGETLQFTEVSGTGFAAGYLMMTNRGGEAFRSKQNKFFAHQHFNKGVAEIAAGSGRVSLDGRGNLYTIDANFADLTVGITQITHYEDLWEGVEARTKYGSTIVLEIKDTTVPSTLKIPLINNVGSPAAGYKPILTDTGTDQSLSNKAYLILTAVEGGWKVISMTDSALSLWQLWTDYHALTQNVEHAYTKTQHTGWKDLGTTAFNTANGVLTVTDEGNSFVAGVPGADNAGILKDIKISRGGASAVTMPNGSIINIKFYHSVFSAGITEPFAIDASSGSQIQSVMKNSSIAPGSPAPDWLYITDGYYTNGHILTFRKSNAKWDIIGFNIEPYIYNTLNTVSSLASVTGWLGIAGLGANFTSNAMSYKKLGTGLIKFRGGIGVSSGAANPVFVLPVGYRPLFSYEAVAHARSGSTIVVMAIQIATNGEVSFSVNGGSISSLYGYNVYFDAISFFNS